MPRLTVTSAVTVPRSEVISAVAVQPLAVTSAVLTRLQCNQRAPTLSTVVDKTVDGQNPLWMPFLATVDNFLRAIF